MKTTKQDFNYFKERVHHWQKELGLMDWSIYVRHDNLNDKMGETRYADEAGVATIILGKDWLDDTVTNAHLDRVAMHEGCHLLFSNLITEAKARYANEYDIDRAEHHIIRVLENVITGAKR